MTDIKPNFKGPVAYLTGEYPRATDTFIQREVQSLRALGIDVLTCSIRTTSAEHHVGPEQRTEAAGTFKVLAAARSPLHLIRCHLWAMRQPVRYLRTFKLAWQTAPAGGKNLLYQLFYFLEAAILARHLTRNKVMHLHNHIAKSSATVAMLTSEMTAIPFSFTLHGPDIFFEPNHWRLDAKIERAQFVACISEFCRSQAMSFSASDHWDKLHIVHCGIQPGRYDAAQPGTSGNRLLFVGRLAAVKGLPVLFTALRAQIEKHPDCQLVLIGDGPERAALEQMVTRMGLQDHVTFAGYKSQDEVAQALGETDIFVLPSFAEGVPVVLMEAMAARVPVITTQIAGIPELVENAVSGLLVPPGASGPLADAIDRLLSDPPLRTKMGQAGRKRVLQEFVTDTEAQKLARLFAKSGGAT